VKQSCTCDRLFGDECDVIFWTIACHYLLKEKQQLLVDVDANNVNVADQHDINKDVDCLDIGFDIYCENSIFQVGRLDIRRIALFLPFSCIGYKCLDRFDWSCGSCCYSNTSCIARICWT
jgi:hypothetical protein